MLKEACVAANVLLCPELINGITGPTLFSSSIWAPQTFDGTVHLPSDKACKLQPLRQPDVVRRKRGEERLVRPHLHAAQRGEATDSAPGALLTTLFHGIRIVFKSS